MVFFFEFFKVIYSYEFKIVYFFGYGDLEVFEVKEVYCVCGIGKLKGLEEVKEEEDELGIILFDEFKCNFYFVKVSVLKELFFIVKVDMEIFLEVVIFNVCYLEG